MSGSPKPCISCGESKPLAEFYVHPQMGDGHLNKCKVCVRQYQSSRQRLLAGDTGWVERERARGREKYRRLGTGRVNQERRQLSVQRYRAKARQDGRIAARNAVRAALVSGRLVRGECERCGASEVDAHHDDYTRPLDVRWLCRTHHGELHRKPLPEPF